MSQKQISEIFEVPENSSKDVDLEDQSYSFSKWKPEWGPAQADDEVHNNEPAPPPEPPKPRTVFPTTNLYKFRGQRSHDNARSALDQIFAKQSEWYAFRNEEFQQ